MNDTYQELSSNSKRLKKAFFKQSFDKVSFISYCVEKSTIRAFHSSKGYVLKYKPLSIFRVWAFTFLSNESNIDKLNKALDFKGLRKSALNSLEKFWTSKDGGRPEFYQFNKLIDLFFKFLPLLSDLKNESKEWLFNNTNVPLDKFSIDFLRKSNSHLDIPEGVSMNHISKENYKEFQKEIKAICKDIPVIIFDLYAWEISHQPKKTFDLIPLDNKSAANIAR